MKNKKAHDEISLRTTAEETLKNKTSESVNIDWDSKRLIHELEVHQIELKMQNEELIIARDTAEKAFEKYRELYDLAPLGYFTIDNSGRIFETNLCGANLLNTTCQNLINNNFKHFIDEHSTRTFNSFLNNISEKNIRSSCEVMLKSKISPSIFVHINGNRNSSGEKCFLSITDISKRKELEISLEKEREKANKASLAKSEFLSNMSHELRTPLNGILGFSEILIDEEEDEKKKSMLTMVSHAGTNLLNLINDILDISKIEAGMLKLNFEEFNMKSAVIEIEAIYEKIAQSKGNRLIVTSSFQSHKMIGDSTKVKQILINLIGNAIKFTENGIIHFDIKEECTDDPHISNLNFMVQDNGIGINNCKMNNLFERFEQGDMSMTKKYGGTGLGLAIVKKLVDLMGGTICVTSELKKGTAFNVTIPFIKVESLKKYDEKFKPFVKEKFDFTKYKILIVDDDEITLELIIAILEQTGINFDVACNGKEVLKKVEENKYDLILMDLQMPEINGLDVTKIIRKREALTKKRVCIIASSAYALKEDIANAMTYDIDDYLSKPFLSKTLLEMLKKQLCNE